MVARQMRGLAGEENRVPERLNGFLLLRQRSECRTFTPTICARPGAGDAINATDLS